MGWTPMFRFKMVALKGGYEQVAHGFASESPRHLPQTLPPVATMQLSQRPTQLRLGPYQQDKPGLLRPPQVKCWWLTLEHPHLRRLAAMCPIRCIRLLFAATAQKT
jgi:hypothetical protein